MARTQLDLQKVLESIEGVKKAYFRKPSKNMQYPCIVYDLANKENVHADNIPYIKRRRWTLTIMDEDPNSPIQDKIEELSYCSFDRSYQADGLNHFVYTLYF